MGPNQARRNTLRVGLLFPRIGRASDGDGDWHLGFRRVIAPSRGVKRGAATRQAVKVLLTPGFVPSR